MEALREIREIDSDKLVIEIPESFRKRKVEIIVLPIDEIRATQSGRFPHFLKNPIKIENFQMPSREERNAR
ncbi:MAG: hypothetical protein PVH61_11370 [Candidatus Aminicenantes bacterium]